MNYPQQGYGQPAQQYPPQAQPQYAPPPAAPAYPPQYPPAQQPQYQPQQYQPQQQYPTQFAPPQPPQQPQAPVIRGTLAGAYEQGVRTGGYGNTCKFMAPGHRKGGYVARDMTDLDVTAETDYATKAPKPDGRGGYRMQMTIPLNVQPGAEHPEGKTTVWAKGRLLTAVVHAMLAVGYDINAGDALKEGDFLDIQRVADVPTNKGNPAHDFIVTVTRAGQQQATPQDAQAQAESLAKSLGVTLGPVVKAATEAENRPEPVMRMGAMAMSASMGAPTPVQPNEVVVPATVSITYQIE